jgi:hypothetical protein
MGYPVASSINSKRKVLHIIFVDLVESKEDAEGGLGE